VLGHPLADSPARSLSADDLQTSVRLQRAGGAAGLDEDDEDEDEEDELEETSPLPSTRAQAEKSRRTQVVKAVSYSPPPGTRAALMMEKGKGKAREPSLRRR
jgi:hypothetical protein